MPVIRVLPSGVRGPVRAARSAGSIDAGNVQIVPSVARYVDLVTAVSMTPPQLGATRLVAVDGPAGSGKSTLSRRLAEAFAESGQSSAVLHTDDLLSGWHDITGFWPRLERWVLAPLRRGDAGRYRRYDWHAGRFGAEWHDVAAPSVLIIEGVTSARAAVRSRLALSLFVTAPSALRLARGLARDGEALHPQWIRWMRAESVHYTADNTRTAVDVVVDGNPALGHDPGREYVRLGGARCVVAAPCQE